MLTEGYSDDTLKKVWGKGKVIPNFDSNVWRSDVCRQPMKYVDYGNRDSEHGWEVDHIIPASKGGSDKLSNLQPLHWKTNMAKGDEESWDCP